MNRFNYLETNSEDDIIKIGMSFVGNGGHVTKIVDRISIDTWRVQHFNPVTRITKPGKYKKEIILAAIADANKPNSIVKIRYE